MESVRWLTDAAVRAGASRIILNGSFVTDKQEPTDVDCAILVGPEAPKDRHARAELKSGVPFIELKIVRQADFDVLLRDTFGTDRINEPKGLIEVIL